jgi:hypothetical protein
MPRNFPAHHGEFWLTTTRPVLRAKRHRFPHESPVFLLAENTGRRAPSPKNRCFRGRGGRVQVLPRSPGGRAGSCLHGYFAQNHFFRVRYYCCFVWYNSGAGGPKSWGRWLVKPHTNHAEKFRAKVSVFSSGPPGGIIPEYHTQAAAVLGQFCLHACNLGGRGRCADGSFLLNAR